MVDVALVYSFITSLVKDVLKLQSHSHDDDDDNDSHKVQLGGGNVYLITTLDRWEEKLSEASRDSKIVSFRHHLTRFMSRVPFLLI